MTTTAHVVGASRDRTNLFISYRSSYAHHPTSNRSRIGGITSNGRFSDNPDLESERAGLMTNLDNSGDAVVEMDLLPPRWLDIQDEITQYLSDITAKTKKLEQLHAKHVLPGFDDESVKAKEEREIEALTQDITRDFNNCQKAIKRVDRMVDDQQRQSNGNISSADITMARNLKISLASRVSEVSTVFRKKQAAYLKKLRSLGGGALVSLDGRASTPVGGSAQNPYTDPAFQESEYDRSSAQSTLQQTAQVRRRTGVLDTTIAQREREIEKIAQGVIDLSNMFQDLQTMVIDQGSLLDRIDYNVERTVEHVKGADKELKIATNYQKRSTKRKIILLLVLIIVGIIILLAVKPRRKAGENVSGHIGVQPPPAAIEDPVDGLPPNAIGHGGQPRDHIDRIASLDAMPARRARWKHRRRRNASDNDVWFE